MTIIETKKTIIMDKFLPYIFDSFQLIMDGMLKKGEQNECHHGWMF